MISATLKPDPVLSTTKTTTRKLPSTSTTATTTRKKMVKAPAKINVEVPIFLRKTYHMVDTCDPAVAAWSDDGETFVVKQPEIFETKIIPQFFKHSKFSSFVRQLNFYGFRKIKFTDTIKIDAKLEAETANFWRFRHDKFIRGRPELLGDIKRSNSSQSAAAKNAKQAQVVGTKIGTGVVGLGVNGVGNGTVKPVGGVAAAPTVVKVVAPTEDVKGLKTEVNTLKNKLESMTANIDKLTNLVEDMKLERSIKVKDVAKFDVDNSVGIGNKRKKIDPNVDTNANAKNDVEKSTTTTPTAAVAANTCTTGLTKKDEVTFTPGSLFPDQVLSRGATTTSNISNISDDAFVDELFNAFQDEDMDMLPDMTSDTDADSADFSMNMSADMGMAIKPDPVVSTDLAPTAASSGSAPAAVSNVTPAKGTNTKTHHNAPDPELMAKLSEALTVLPKEIQEMLVNRLISTITISDALKAHVDKVCNEFSSSKSLPKVIPIHA